MFRLVFFAVADKGLAFRHDASVFYDWTRNAFCFVVNTGAKSRFGASGGFFGTITPLAQENFGGSGRCCWLVEVWPNPFSLEKPSVYCSYVSDILHKILYLSN
jgi:hypothetical protein